MISKSRNVIQNGNFDVWQRGTTFTSPTSGTVLADRWKTGTALGDGTFTVSQDSGVPNNSSLYSLKIACTHIETAVASTERATINQAIEGNFFMSVRDKPMTLSFWVKAYQTGIFCVSLRSSGSDEAFVAEYTINASATWEKKVIQISPIPAGTWATGTALSAAIWFGLMSGAGDSFQGVTGWQAENKFFTSNQSNLLSSTNNYIQFSQVQLEAGTAATEFDAIHYADELARCQRYFIRYSGPGYYGNMLNYNTTDAYGAISLPVEMRAKPTRAVSTAANGYLLRAGSSVNLTAWPAGSVFTTKVFLPYVQVAAGLTAGQATLLNINTGQYFELSADI